MNGLLFLISLLLCLQVGGVGHHTTPLCSNFVSGTVFEDRNNNGIQEQTEPYTSAMVRLEHNGQLYAEKLAEAEFGFIFENVPCGAYEVFVASHFTRTIQVHDTGPPESLNLPLRLHRYFCPTVRNG